MARMDRMKWLLWLVVMASMAAHAQSAATVDVRMHLAIPHQAHQVAPPAVLWLKSFEQTSSPPMVTQGRYTLLQKNRMFTPHLLVVPVGSIVTFPNADPFFHNVFSLFDGKRFDLGLYEAGSAKEVTFSREGVSYIFCNIHPEMSAVVLALSTSFYSIADANGAFRLRNIPAGDYELHVWIEGVPEPVLEKATRRVHLAPDTGDLGAVDLPGIGQRPQSHTNKFGQTYDKEPKQTY